MHAIEVMFHSIMVRMHSMSGDHDAAAHPGMGSLADAVLDQTQRFAEKQRVTRAIGNASQRVLVPSVDR